MYLLRVQPVKWNGKESSRRDLALDMVDERDSARGRT